MYSFSIAVSPLLTTSTSPLLVKMGHPLLWMSAALGQLEEESLPASTLCNEPCTEMNLAEVHVVTWPWEFSVVQEVTIQELFICSGYYNHFFVSTEEGQRFMGGLVNPLHIPYFWTLPPIKPATVLPTLPLSIRLLQIMLSPSTPK